MLWNDGTMKVGVVGSWIGKSIAVDRNNRFPGILPCETRAAVAAATFASDDACWASLRETAKSEFVQWCAVVVKFILDRSFPARSLKFSLCGFPSSILNESTILERLRFQDWSGSGTVYYLFFFTVAFSIFFCFFSSSWPRRSDSVENWSGGSRCFARAMHLVSVTLSAWHCQTRSVSSRGFEGL